MALILFNHHTYIVPEILNEIYSYCPTSKHKSIHDRSLQTQTYINLQSEFNFTDIMFSVIIIPNIEMCQAEKT